LVLIWKSSESPIAELFCSNSLQLKLFLLILKMINKKIETLKKCNITIKI
jgi:hypothetical protein